MTRRAHGLVEHGMVQWRIVLTCCAVLVAWGVYSFFTMPRQEFPEFTIRQGLVVGVMPGATTAEVEEQLTRPVEEYLFSFNEIDKKKTYSVSRHGQVVVYVTVDDGLDAHATAAFWSKLRLGLGELKSQKLSSRVLALVGNNEFGDTSALLFTVAAPGHSSRDLARYVEVLETQLRRIDATAKLRRSGLEREVLRVTIDRSRLAQYGIRPATVFAALQGLGAPPLPARLDLEPLELPIHLSPVLRSEQELGQTLVLALPDGTGVRLADVATLTREYGHDDSYVRFDGQPAVLLSIEMKPGNDITRFGQQVDLALAQTRQQLPPDVQIARVADQPQVVATSVNHFLRDFGLAIVAVILVTMLLLPIRVASVAAITIPVTIAITLGLLHALDVSLQTVSLAGLIVVLGMVVDNAIVIIDDYVEKLDRGLDRWAAAVQSARELAAPVVVATLAIICSFAPMAFVLDGVAGEFLSSLPITVTVALGTSLAVSLFFVPIVNKSLIRRGLHREPGQRASLLDVLQRHFDRGLEGAFRHPALTIALGVGAVAAALALVAILPIETFPKVERNQFAVEVYLPNGRSLAQTDRVVRQVAEQLQQDPRVVHVTSFVGQSSPRFHTLYAPQMPARNFGQLLVNTVSEQATVEVLREQQQRFQGTFPDAWVRYKQLDFQPGSPIEIRVSGDDLEALRQAAARITAHARTIPGTTWVRNDFEELLPALEVTPDPDASARLGVPPSLLQLSLALGQQGLPVGTIWEGDYPVQVLLQDEEGERRSLQCLGQQLVSSTMAAAAVPLQQVARLDPVVEAGAIVRRNGVRTVTVSVDVGLGVIASEVQRQLDPFLAGLDLGPGLRIELGGERELSAETMIPMAGSMLLSAGLIFLVLLVQFQRFRKALLVMAAMPLSLLGAFAGMWLMRYPFGLTSFMGVISLMGIVVRNGIILVSYAEQLREEGLSTREAALAAGKRRMRPIYLTSMAAAIGVVPMILSRSTLWGPVGTVTCFGLIVAMVLTLFVLPVAFWLTVAHERTVGRPTPPPASRLPAAVASLVAACLLFVPSLARGADEGPLTLARCRELAVERGVSLALAREEVRAAEAQQAGAATAYLPKVEALALGVATHQPMMKFDMPGGNLPVYDGNPANLPTASQFAYFPGAAISGGQQITALSLTAFQPLYAGGRIRNGNRLAALGVEAARAKEELARREALAQTEEKYWRLVSLYEKQPVLVAADRLLAALAREVASATRAGLITRNDELKLDLQRQQLAADRARLSSGIALASQDLRHQLGLSGAGPLALAPGVPTPADPGGTPPEARLGQRPELRLRRLAIEAATLQTELAKGKRRPSLTVGGSLMRYDVDGLTDGGQANALVFGMASVPLSALLWEGQHEEAAAALREGIARRELADTEQLLQLQLQKAWEELTAAWREVQLGDAAVAQAEVEVGEATDRHRQGLETVSSLLAAQLRQQEAQLRRVDARTALALKQAAWRRVAMVD